MSKKVKKMFEMILFTLVIVFAFGIYVEAWSVSKNSKKSPKSLNKGAAATYSLSVNYDSTVYGIPIPVDGHIGIELPCSVFASAPTYNSGSFSSMKFTKKTGSMTGKSSYQSYKTFAVVGNLTKSYSVSAKAKNSSGVSGQAYMGTGPYTITGYDYFFTVETK